MALYQTASNYSPGVEISSMLSVLGFHKEIKKEILTRGPWWPWIAHLSHFPQKWILHLCSFGSNVWHRGWGQFDPTGHHMNKIDKGLQGDATYQKSMLYPFQFQRRRILKLVFFLPMFQLVTPRVGSVFTQRNHMNKIDKGSQRHAKYQISKL